jgi:hypothetical protein
MKKNEKMNEKMKEKEKESVEKNSIVEMRNIEKQEKKT